MRILMASSERDLLPPFEAKISSEIWPWTLSIAWWPRSSQLSLSYALSKLFAYVILQGIKLGIQYTDKCRRWNWAWITELCRGTHSFLIIIFFLFCSRFKTLKSPKTLSETTNRKPAFHFGISIPSSRKHCTGRTVYLQLWNFTCPNRSLIRDLGSVSMLSCIS